MTNKVAMNQPQNQPTPPNQPTQGPGSWTDYLKYLSTPYLAYQNRENLIGKDASIEQMPRYTQQQMDQQDALSRMGMERLQGGDNFNFSPIEQRLRRLHSEEQLPTISNRFLAGQAGDSSAYQNALRGGNLDLEERIGMEENRMKQQQFQEGLQLLGMGQQQQYENVYRPEDWGLLGNASDAGFKLLSAYLAGVPGAIAASGGGGASSNQAPILPNQQGGQQYSQQVGGQGINQILDFISQTSNYGRPRDFSQQPEPTQRSGDVNSLQNLVQSLGTVDINKLRQQKLARQIQQLRSQYNFGV
jgi:hypothetical protein